MKRRLTNVMLHAVQVIENGNAQWRELCKGINLTDSDIDDYFKKAPFPFRRHSRRLGAVPPSKGELPPREKLPLPIGMSTCLVIASPIAFHSSVFKYEIFY